MLTIENLSSFYADSQILWDINIDIPKEKITCLLGRNGAGKTTLLKSIIGLVRHDGKITLQNQNIATLPAYQRPSLGIAYVPQGRRLFAELTVMENLRIGLNANTNDGKQHNTILESIYEMFPILQTRLTQISGTLSGGEQQALAIARALCLQPKLLLLDEPTEGLMPSAIDTIYKTILNLKQNGVAVLLVEQRLDRLLQIADKIIFIENGRITDQLEDTEQPISLETLNKYIGVKV